MANFFEPDLIALLVQALGALLMAALCIALLRTMSRPALRYWSMGWVMLCISLQGLYLATYSEAFRLPGHVIYLLGEYVFGYWCTSVAGGTHLGSRRSALISGCSCRRPSGASGCPSSRGGDVNVLFAVHALVFPYLFFRALRVLGGVTASPHVRVGLARHETGAVPSHDRLSALRAASRGRVIPAPDPSRGRTWT